MNKYPLPMPDPYNPPPAVLVENEEQYNDVTEFMTIACKNSYSVANQPKRNKTTKLIVDEAFPFLVQICWLPWCGEHVRCWNTGVKHNNYLTYEEFRR